MLDERRYLALASRRQTPLPLYRGAHSVAPLRPGAVVVSDVIVPEQVLEHEPRVGAALSNAAVSHDVVAFRESCLALDYETFVDRVGREAVGSRTRNATLGLSTLKSAVRKYQKDSLRSGSTAEPACSGG